MHQRLALIQELAAFLPRDILMDRMAIGAPERFRVQALDLLVVLPGLTGDMSAERAARLASSAVLYHDSIASARLGVHVVGNSEHCRKAGSYAAALHDHARTAAMPVENMQDGAAEPSLLTAARRLVTELLDNSGLCWRAMAWGFLVFSPFGALYELRLGDWAEPPRPDEARPPRLTVLLDPAEVLREPEQVAARIGRLT